MNEILDLECKLLAEDTGEVTGIASVWGEPDAYGDTIDKGAFAKSLAEHKAAETRPLFFFNHRSDEVIGVWDAVTETAKGLEVKGRLITETQRGREAHALLKAGALNGLSIGFRTRGAKKGANGGRILNDIDLVEISLVPLPAAAKARVTGVKKADGNSAKLLAFARSVALATETMKVKK